ncbi:MAG: hypothetical protein ACYC6A_10305 [Armatimonadota bacterium]
MNHFREALREPGNLVGLGAAVALSAGVAVAVANPLPLLAGPVLEILYLAVVPNSSWYRGRLSACEKAKEDKRRQAMNAKVLSTLRADMQQRYARLEAARRQIATQMQPDEKWFSDVTPRLDSLLDKFLTFAGKESTFLQYLRGLRNEIRDEDLAAAQAAAPPPDESTQLDPTQRWGQQTVELVQAAYAHEQEELSRELASAPDEGTRVLLKKRAEILAKRIDYLVQIGKILLNLGYQLQLLEDSFGLINDQLRARAPEQIVADIDQVVSQTDTMVKVLDELAPYEQMVSGLELSTTLARWNA